jgi:hypothetical protein
MDRRCCLFVVAVLALPLQDVAGAEDQDAAVVLPESALVEPAAPAAKEEAARTATNPARYATWIDPNPRDAVIRFGWWGVQNSGSPNKVGEYQSLAPSPFWDLDGLSSDGTRTVDFSATQTDQEGYFGRLNYFGPLVSAKVDYEQFLHRLDSWDFGNFPNNVPTSGTKVLNHTTLNAGQDYAIRVQEFNAKFKGPLGEDAKWRLNVFGMNKEGERQASKLGHCYNDGVVSGNRCHVQAQSQHIDWRTAEIEPCIETTLGPLTVEYSRAMRVFDQDDQIVTRRYSNGSHPGWPIANADVPYGFVSPNRTQIDRLKMSADITDNNHFYGLLYTGDTLNRERDTHRFINGYDFRLTNESIAGVKITGYGKRTNEAGQLPTFFPEDAVVQGGDSIALYHSPLSYDKTAAGVKGQWRPFTSGWPVARGVAFTGGYEYSLISRSFAEYEIEQSPALSPNPITTFDQPDTLGHMVFFGVSNRWSACFDSFVRYKRLAVDNPIYGVRSTSGDVNTNQIGQSDLVEFGGTWTPSDSFLLTASIGVEKRRQHSFQDNVNNAFALSQTNPRETDFDEDNYPIVVTAWYAPAPKWSLSGGYATFSNWIDQLITLGDQYNDGAGSVEPNPAQSRWRYGGQAHVVNLGAAYAYSPRLKVLGGWEHTWSRNAIDAAPSPATALDSSGNVIVPNWTAIPGLSAVSVETTRLTAGVDYALRERITVYGRYVYYDYRDKSSNLVSGTTNGILGGISATY